MIRFAKPAVAAAVLFTAAAAHADGAADTFQKKCALCHGKDGKGHTAMAEKMGVKDLTTLPASAEDLEKTITDGKGKMPSFKDKLSGPEIKAIAAFIKGGLK